jgi:hypothetical protein
MKHAKGAKLRPVKVREPASFACFAYFVVSLNRLHCLKAAPIQDQVGATAAVWKPALSCYCSANRMGTRSGHRVRPMASGMGL